MVQANFNEFGTDGARVATFGKVVNGLGAVTSLALILGLGVWGYRLAVRDVSGVPVIQALQGPMRIAPDDPGGQVAAHMGLSVNRVAAEGTAGAVPDSLTLAPATVSLAEDDAPGLAGSAQLVPSPSAASLALDAGVVASLAVDQNLITGVTLNDTLIGSVSGVEVSEPATMATSPRPRARPARTTEVVSIDPADAIAAATAAALAEVLGTADNFGIQPLGVIDAVALSEGTRLAQIGAFDDEASALREWDRLSGLHGDVFAGKARVIQTATSAGRTFYRLRVHGFDSEEATRGFCSALESPEMRCIPVIHR